MGGLPVPRAIVVTTENLLAQLRTGGPKAIVGADRAGRADDRRRRGAPGGGEPSPAGGVRDHGSPREVDTLVPEPGARCAVRSSASSRSEAGALGRPDCSCRASMSPAARCWKRSARCWVPRSRPPPWPYPRAARPALDNLDFAVLIHEFVQVSGAGRVRTRRARSRSQIENPRGQGEGNRGPRARPHRGGRARAGEGGRAGRARMGRGGWRTRVLAPTAAAIARALARKPPHPYALV